MDIWSANLISSNQAQRQQSCSKPTLLETPFLAFPFTRIIPSAHNTITDSDRYRQLGEDRTEGRRRKTCCCKRCSSSSNPAVAGRTGEAASDRHLPRKSRCRSGLSLQAPCLCQIQQYPSLASATLQKKRYKYPTSRGLVFHGKRHAFVRYNSIDA